MGTHSSYQLGCLRQKVSNNPVRGYWKKRGCNGLPTGPLKPTLDWCRYRDANPVPTSSLASDIATAPSGPVIFMHLYCVYLSNSFQPVLHDWCNKGRGMCYPVCGMVHIKEPLLLIDKRSLCGGSGFPFSLSEWSLTMCLTPYNRR